MEKKSLQFKKSFNYFVLINIELIELNEIVCSLLFIFMILFIWKSSMSVFTFFFNFTTYYTVPIFHLDLHFVFKFYINYWYWNALCWFLCLNMPKKSISLYVCFGFEEKSKKNKITVALLFNIESKIKENEKQTNVWSMVWIAGHLLINKQQKIKLLNRLLEENFFSII